MEGSKIVESKNNIISFEHLPDDLRKLIIQLERDKIIKIIEEGIILNERIKDSVHLQDQSRNLILSAFSLEESNYLIFVFNLLLKRKFNWLDWKSLLNNYINKTKSPMEEEVISIGVENPKKKDKTRDSNGGSHPSPSNFERREPENFEPKKLSDVPIQMVPELLNKRKNDFGIWISKVALRHFQSLMCYLDTVNDPIFSKFEQHFDPEYATNRWATPISNAKRDEMGINFSFQMSEKGTIRIHPNTRDIQAFTRDFFTIFKPILTDDEIIRFLELLSLERKKKPVYKIHDARHIGPKKIIKEEFKGAHVKVNEVHWFGKINYDVRVDWSEPSRPHIESQGPVAQTGNLMKLIDGSPEFISNLTEVRELSYNSNDKIHENHVGIGKLSDIVMNNNQALQLMHKDTMSYISEVDAHLNNIELQTQIRHEDLIHKLKLIKKEFPHLKDLFIEAYKKNSEENIKLRKFLADTVIGIMDLQTIVHDDNEQILNEIQQVFLDTSNDMNNGFEGVHGAINGAKDEIVQVFNDKFDTFKDLVFKEFKDVRFAIKHSLYLILRKIDRVPGLTAKELSKSMKVSQKTVYNYLKRLQENGIIISEKKKTSGRGRPSRSFTLNLKKILKLKEKLKR